MEVKCDVIVWNKYNSSIKESVALGLRIQKVYISNECEFTGSKIIKSLISNSFKRKIQFPTAEKGSFEFFLTSNMLEFSKVNIFISYHFCSSLALAGFHPQHWTLSVQKLAGKAHFSQQMTPS